MGSVLERNGRNQVEDSSEVHRRNLVPGVAHTWNVPDLRVVSFVGTQRLIAGLAKIPGDQEGFLGRSVGIIVSGELGPVHG